MIVCPKCGGQLADGAKFCKFCGSATIQPQPQAPVHNNVQSNVQKPAPQKPKKKKSSKNIVLAIIAVILVIAIAVGGWLLWDVIGEKKKEDLTDEEKLTQILEESTTKPIIEFVYDDYDSDGTCEAYAVVGETDEEDEKHPEFYDADIYFVNHKKAQPIKENVSGKVNGTIKLEDIKYISIEVYEDGTDEGKSFIYTADGTKSDEADISGKYSRVHKENGRIVGLDENGNEVEIVASSEKTKQQNQVVATNWGATFAIKNDGTVLSTVGPVTGSADFFCGIGNVTSWSDVVSISAGHNHVVGLKKDGTVVSTRVLKSVDQFNGDEYNVNFGQDRVEDWSDIVAVSAGMYHTVGLKSDGTVVSTEMINATETVDYGQTDVESWTDIKKIYATYGGTIGVKSDGTVVAVGVVKDADGWTDIVDISNYYDTVAGLKSDGTVVAIGDNIHGECDVEGWTDIVQVETSGMFTAGLKSDGTVVVTHFIDDYGWTPSWLNATEWTDIVAIAVNSNHIYGLKADGTVVSSKDADSTCPCEDVSTWSDVIAIYNGNEQFVAITSDGVALGTQCRKWEDGDFGQGELENWTDIKLPE